MVKRQTLFQKLLRFMGYILSQTNMAHFGAYNTSKCLAVLGSFSGVNMSVVLLLLYGFTGYLDKLRDHYNYRHTILKAHIYRT